MGANTRSRIITLLRRVADNPGFDWDSFVEVNRLLANRLVDQRIGAALNEATALYLDWKQNQNLSAAEFYETTAERRQQIREFVSAISAEQVKHGGRH
jgi:hypothetical protein